MMYISIMDKVIYRKEKPYTEKRVDIPNSSVVNNTPVKIFFLAISVILLYNVFHSVKITVQKLEILKNARVEVESLRLENLELALLLDDMQSVEYVEIQARDRLNFGSKNEYVFVIPEDALGSARGVVEKLLSEENALSSKELYAVWWEFLRNGI